MKTVAALFVCASSAYWSMPGVDCYDVARDARSFPGGSPVVAHPPCALWGKLEKMAKREESERDLAHFALAQVRENGGVLEHPARSRFFTSQGILPGVRDSFGGYVVPILQFWFGHRADKATWLYICKVPLIALPPLPLQIGYMSRSVEMMGKPERERTPVELASWLVNAARGVQS